MLQRSQMITWSIAGVVLFGAIVFLITFWFGTPVSYLTEGSTEYPGEFIQLENAAVHYTVSGDTASTAPKLVLLHSGGWSGVEYQEVLPELNTNYTVFTVDLPGFGFSDKPQQTYSVEYIADVLPQLLEQLPGNEFHIVAASTTATGVLLSAADNTDSIVSITAISPLGFGSEINQAAVIAQIPVIGEALATSYPTSFDITLNRGIYADDSVSDTLRESLYNDSKHMKSSRARLGLLRSTLSTRGVDEVVTSAIVEAAPRIEQPILLLWGENDTYALTDQSESAKELLPNAQLKLLPETGHFAHLEQPSTVATQVNNFIKAIK